MKILSINTLIIGLLFFTFSSCETAEKKATVPNEFKAEQLLSNVANLQHILTADMVSKVSEIPKEQLTFFYQDFSDNPSEHKLAYTWDSGKEIQLGGGKHTIHQFFSLGIANVKQMDATTFTETMGSAAGLQKQVDALAKDTMLSKDIAIEEAAYKKEYAKNQQLTEVKDVGDLAYWEMPIQVLHVFANGVAFSITANFGKEETQNKSKAIALAAEIFNHKMESK